MKFFDKFFHYFKSKSCHFELVSKSPAQTASQFCHTEPKPVILNLFDCFCRNLLISCKMSGFPQDLTGVLGFLSIADICNKNMVPSMTSVKNNHSPTTSLFNGPFIQISSIPRKSKSVTLNSFQGLKHSMAFSLVELLMALLVASLLMAALAPVMTKRITENIHVDGNMNPPSANVKKIEINYNSNSPENNFKCTEIKTDADGSEYCEGEFTAPNDYNGIMKVTVIGAGGGGGTAPTAGYTEYTTVSNSHQFTVPVMVNEIEATLMEGGAGGGGGWIDPEIKGFAWTHTGALNRSYVPTSIVNENIKNIKVSGDSIAVNQSSYAHGSATLSANETKYIAGSKVYVTMAGGGGGGGRGHIGTGGGGGAAYKRQPVTITNGYSYNISVGSGGKGHACGGFAGCGGAASKFGDLLTAGGGGGGVHGPTNTACTKGEFGGDAGKATSESCVYSNYTYPRHTGGFGVSPNGQNGAGQQSCGMNLLSQCVFGGNGGGSLFGAGGVYSVNSSDNRHGKGYGSGGCGGGGNTCTGGDADPGPSHTGDGAPGFVAVEWYNYANGGAGGAGGSIVPLKRLNVAPNDVLTLEIGAGGTGGAAGSVSVNSSTGAIAFTAPSDGNNGNSSFLKKGNTILLRTSHNTPTSCSSGACRGDASGKCNGTSCNSGHVQAEGQVYNPSLGTSTVYPDFIITAGKTAGNRNAGYTYEGTLTVTDKGGDGGTTATPFTGTCVAAKGGVSINSAGQNATGHGCGGGGGYGFAKGGDGSGGYARISWNKYWDAAASVYKNADIGAGGGGASGNVLTYTVSVIGGQKIRLRIGKGGSGATVANNIIINAQKGGDTVFGDSAFGEIKAGGGYGGGSPSVNLVTGAFTNGAGGAISNICHYKSTSFLNKSSCQKGIKGFNAENASGGKGADLAKYGTGGAGGVSGDNSDGEGALNIGYGAGGGGAALRDLGKVDSSVQTNITRNQNKGGSGSNGKIIVEWWE